MKNRDKYILQKNEYDMLMDAQIALIQGFGEKCIIDAIAWGEHPCPKEMTGKVGMKSKLDVCSKCIQQWLNEEV